MTTRTWPIGTILLAAIAGVFASSLHAKTVAQLVEESPDHHVFAELLDATRLEDKLGREGPFTVFAPTDQAFAKLPQGAVVALLRPENRAALLHWLKAHIVPTKLLTAEARPGVLLNLEGQELPVDVDNGRMKVGNAAVAGAESVGSNGVLHSIDHVLVP
jgi:uncharacterized surface protein with fasciclin (FAS1) repeats